jgi:hypothetical protein
LQKAVLETHDVLKIHGTTVPQQIELDDFGVAAREGLVEKNGRIVESLLSSVSAQEILE